MPSTKETKTRFEHAEPILNVKDMSVSLKYYVDVLGFRNADWGGDDFTHVARDTAGIYLCHGSQGQPGTWVWLGVGDVAALYEEYKASGAKIREKPENYSWAYEMKVEDPDGHVLRFGSDPRTDESGGREARKGESSNAPRDQASAERARLVRGRAPDGS